MSALHQERGRIWSRIIDALQGPYTDFSDKIKDPKWRSFVDVRLHGIVWGTKEASIRAFEKWRETAKPYDLGLKLEAIKDKQFPQEDAPKTLGVRAGRCPVCSSWTLNPREPNCQHCEGKVAPLEPLEVFLVEDGVRVNVQGRLFGTNGQELHARVFPNPEEKLGTVAYLRALLLDYDEGKMTESSVGYEVFRHVIDRVVDRAKSGDETMAFTSWCGPKPDPAETLTLTIETSADHVFIKRVPV